MTKKKEPKVIKLDKRTMTTTEMIQIRKATNELGNALINSAINGVIPMCQACENLDYSGHKYIADAVIRLQRNANSAIMVMDILRDILLCMLSEEKEILYQLQQEEDMMRPVEANLQKS